MDEDLNTLEGALAFLNRIRAEAQQRGTITLRPHQFIRAIELGAIEYIAATCGASIGGNYIGEYSPQISGAPVVLAQ